MNSSITPPLSRRPRGSALLTVIILATVMTLIAGAILTWSVAERRMNVRNSYWLEAHNAAEALCEFGVAQVVNRYNNVANPPNFTPGTANAPIYPAWSTTNTNSFFNPNGTTGESNVDTTVLSTTDPYGMELVIGPPVTIKNNGNYYIDAADVNNITDPVFQKETSRRDINVLGKATVLPPEGGLPVTAFVKETVSVRGGPLFANAIFYANNDLEISPGPNFDIYGPVQVNGNMFLSAQGTIEGVSGGNYIAFHDTVQVSGDIYHAWASTVPGSNGHGSESLGNDPLQFLNNKVAGTLTNMISSASGGKVTWIDSTYNGTTPTDSTLFAGSNNISSGSGSYTAAAQASSTPLVVPAVYDSNGNVTTPESGQLGSLATTNQNAFQTAETQAWHGNVQTTADKVQPYNPIGYTQPIDAAGDLPDPHTIIEPPATVPSGTYASAYTAVENAKFSNKANLYVKVVVTVGSPSTATITLTGPGGTTLTAPTSSKLVTFVPYAKSSNNVTTGLYDQRQNAGIDLVQIDASALRAALTDAVNNSTSDNKAITTALGAAWGNGGVATGWNGAMYVEVDGQNSSGATAPTNASVILVNGTVASGSSLVPTLNNTIANPTTGLTLATNAPMYILGNFNTDGAVASGATGSATTPDDGGTDATGSPSAESPTALAADAITILSPGYFGSSTTVPSDALATSHGHLVGNSGNAYNSYSTPAPNSTGQVSIAAAFITGFVATSSSAYSGAVNNLPRFLEYWSPGGTQQAVSIRGSLVSLYQSKIATGTWAQAYYSAPNRIWGFDVIFKNGNLPPQTPISVSFRRLFFSDLPGIAPTGTPSYTSLRTDTTYGYSTGVTFVALPY
jgi:Tfp pilus assembly protein PilX